MKHTITKRKLILIMLYLLISTYTIAQTETRKLSIPEFMDFTFMQCDFNTTIKENKQIDQAFNRGLNAVYTANNQAFVNRATQMGMVGLSNYTLSKYKPLAPKDVIATTFVFARERSDGYIRNAIIDQCFVEYASTTLYGKAEWIKKLIKNSLTLKSRFIGKNRLMVNITNHSSIPYTLQIQKADGLTTESNVISLSGNDNSIFFFTCSKPEINNYQLVTTILNTHLTDGDKLEYTFDIPGMQYIEGYIPQQDRLAIIPLPNSITPTPKEGVFVINHQTRIIIKSEKAKKTLHFLTNRFETVTDFTLPIVKNKSKTEDNAIIFTTSHDPQLGKEGYSLNASKQNIRIEANEEAGFFYAIQTLLQLLPNQIYSNQKESCSIWDVPSVKITDTPRFEYRGMHLDVGRHMFPVNFIKKYIDLLSMQKMNRFHWHLTDDQGWRIEIKKYPKLTEIGSVRKGTIANRYTTLLDPIYDQTPYGGYYTQEEIKDVVQYAKDRYVTVIPEIDLPGHMLAALTTYPELGCTGGPYEVGTRWGIYDDVLCAGNEKIYPFIENILKEVFTLFPSEYVHIGGDECPKVRWKKCPKCQAKIKNENLKDEHELQSYVIRRTEKFLNNHGKRLIGWDEILEGGIAPNATLMSWRGVAGGIKAAQSGHPVIMTPNTHVYLDHYQANMDISPLGNGRVASLEWTYSYNPIPQELKPEEAPNIKGVQANIWTEYLRTPEMVEYMAFPRANAVAEIGWTNQENRSWDCYLKRLQTQFDRWSFYNLNYATHYKTPLGE